ncbi:hypothetical protein [Nocardia abscessus]|nr:hypothetical protein [Nocardia abscessus]
MTSAVYLVTGIQAAGKSIVAQALAERLPRSAHTCAETCSADSWCRDARR